MVLTTTIQGVMVPFTEKGRGVGKGSGVEMVSSD